MAILPEGFALPPPAYLLLLVATGVPTAWALRRRRPPVTSARVLAFAPWMVFGSALHVLYVVDALPPLIRPLAGTPAVYVSVAIVAATAWLAVDAAFDGPTVARTLAAAGTVPAVATVGAVLAVGAAADTFSPLLPAAGVVVATALAGAVWAALTRAVPDTRRTGALGTFAVFAHALDGVSTAVGVDLLGFGERTPLSRILIEFAAGLPTADAIGGGWLFVLVKIGVAALVVWLFADLIEVEPTQARLLLGFVAAVGLGPAVHNVLLFTISAPA